MAVRQQFLLVLVVVYAVVPALTFETSSCDKICGEKYPSIFATQPAKSGTCSRGCRFFAIGSLIRRNDDEADILNNCFESCGMAYKTHRDDSMDVCQFGCKKQTESGRKQNEGTDKEDFIKSLFNMNHFASMIRQRMAEHRPQVSINVDVEKNEGDKDEKTKVASAETSNNGEAPEGISFDAPVMSVRRVVAQVVGSFHILRSSVMTYFRQPDDTLVAVQSHPQVMVEMVPEEGISSPEDAVKPAEHPSIEQRSQDQGPIAKLRESVFGPDGQLGDHVTKVSLSSSRYGYLMHLLLLLGSVSLCLLGISYCLALVRSQRNNKQKAANLTVALQHEPLKLVRPEDLTKLSIMDEEDQQAPALPNKQDLALQHANI